MAASGFNVIDFMDLPAVERCIVRLLLRQVTLTYPELREAVATLPADQTMDQGKLDATLDHLTLTHWLTCQIDNQQTLYSVNSIRRSSGQNQGVWDILEPESIDLPKSFQLNLETEDTSSTQRSKRALPSKIWECLDDPTPEPAPRQARRQTGLLDKLVDDASAPKDK